MGLKRIISDKKEEWRQLYKEASSAQDPRIQEASQRVLQEQVSPAPAETSRWKEVEAELTPYAGHLVIMGDLYDLKSTNHARDIAARIKKRMGGREPAIGFSVHPSSVKADDLAKFLEGAKDLKIRMKQENFEVSEDEIQKLKAANGIGIDQIAHACQQTEQSMAAKGKDYLHIAIVDPTQMSEINIEQSAMPSTEDVAVAPFMLLGFGSNGKPKWTDISRPSPVNEIS